MSGARPVRLFALEGVFDMPVAASLRDVIVQLDPEDRVIVDCHEVRDLQDSAFAFLAWSLFSRRRPVLLRGLGEHHLRLLRHLGVEGVVEAGFEHRAAIDAP